MSTESRSAIPRSGSSTRCHSTPSISFQVARKALDHKTLLRVLEIMGVRDTATAHGFRSTFRDWGAEVGDYPNQLLELAIAHAVGNAAGSAWRRRGFAMTRK